MNILNYKKEELVLFNMKKLPIYVNNPNNRNGFTIYEIENELSIKEKISFIDKMEHNFATKMLNFINKWNQDKETMPKDSYGNPKTVSVKAWAKKNIDDMSTYVYLNVYNKIVYNAFGKTYREVSDISPSTECGHNYEYTGNHIVHQWFHDMLHQLYLEEKKYFEENDSVNIKLKQVKEYGKYLPIFNNKEINDIVWNNKKNVKEENLDIYIEVYEQLENYIKNAETQLKDKIGKHLFYE